MARKGKIDGLAMSAQLEQEAWQRLTLEQREASPKCSLKTGFSARFDLGPYVEGKIDGHQVWIWCSAGMIDGGYISKEEAGRLFYKYYPIAAFKETDFLHETIRRLKSEQAEETARTL